MNLKQIKLISQLMDSGNYSIHININNTSDDEFNRINRLTISPHIYHCQIDTSTAVYNLYDIPLEQVHVYRIRERLDFPIQIFEYEQLGYRKIPFDNCTVGDFGFIRGINCIAIIIQKFDSKEEVKQFIIHSDRGLTSMSDWRSKEIEDCNQLILILLEDDYCILRYEEEIFAIRPF